jgi:SAM-dependent methyltransferase
MKPRDPTELRRTFDSAAERYDRVRPGYPPEVFEDLATLAGLEAGSRVLEIGCGTGQATVSLAKRGYRIVAVELGPELATVARRRLAAYPNVEVVLGGFEEWALPRDRFDAVVSATAFHWIDPEIRVTKAAEALRPGGSLAVIETRRNPVGEDVLANLPRCHERWDPSAERPIRPLSADELPESRDDIDRSGFFARIETRRYEWAQTYTTSDYLDLVMTFSSVLALESPARSGLIDCIRDLIDGDLGGLVTERCVNRLVVAQKVAPGEARILRS